MKTTNCDKNWQVSRNFLIGTIALILAPGCTEFSKSYGAEQPNSVADTPRSSERSFITVNRKSLLSADTEDLVSLSKQERDLILNDHLPDLSDAEWKEVLDKMSGVEWEQSLNKRAVEVMDKDCDLIRYKWVYYREANSEFLDYRRHEVYPKSQTLCITDSFKSIRGPNSNQNCLLKIHPVNRTSETLTCEAGLNGIPKSFALLTDIGEEEHSPIPMRCKFRQKVMLHYPTCTRK